jgi:hypothetical protein
VACVVALAPLSEAKIVYTKAHIVLGEYSNTSHKLDLNHDGIVDFFLGHQFASWSTSRAQYFFSDVFVPWYTKANSLNGVAVTTSGVDAIALRPGMKIGHIWRNLTTQAGWHSRGARLIAPPTTYEGEWAKGLQNRYPWIKVCYQGQASLRMGPCKHF